MDGARVCQICGKAFEKWNSLQKHADRTHQVRVKKKTKMSNEERKQRQGAALRKHRAKKQEEKLALKREQQPRALFTVKDARERGHFQCLQPLLDVKQSTIDGAGNGLFAVVDFVPGDIVTWLSGRKTKKEPKDPSYAIAVEDFFLDAIRKPSKGKGLGSFVNREVRHTSKRKNCRLVEEDDVIWVQMAKKVRSGEELFCTYGRGYRI
jgi:hypothetical protein